MNNNFSFLDFPKLGPLLCVALSACGGDSDSPVPLPPRAAALALPQGGAIGTAQWPEGSSAAGGQGEPVAGLVLRSIKTLT